MNLLSYLELCFFFIQNKTTLIFINSQNTIQFVKEGQTLAQTPTLELSVNISSVRTLFHGHSEAMELIRGLLALGYIELTSISSV